MSTLFNNRYKIIKTIGSGGMGTVYLAESISLGTKWAIKAIEKKASSNYDLLAEPNILKKLKHPALPRIVDIEQDDDYLYIIEDYIAGDPLDKQLELRKSFDEATVIEWTKQLCEVLIYLHTNKPNPIIYRDMKPSNIIVSSDNKLTLIDFGIAREFKTDSGSDTSYMGTRGYAAPEQYGTSQTDERTDIYSLGVTIYHLLTGKSPNEPPYEFKPLRLIDKNFSEGIEFIVGKCVQNNPENRYQNAYELLDDLNNIYKFNSYYKKQKTLEKLKSVAKVSMLIGFSVVTYFGLNTMSQERMDKYKNLVDSGYEALNLYKFDEALESFNEANSVISKDKSSYLGIAQISLNKGEYEECLSYLDSLTTIIPEIDSDAQYNYLKGDVYYENKEYEKSVKYFQKAVDIEPSNIEYGRNLAVSYAKSGNIKKSREILDLLLESGASDDVLQYVNSEVLLAEGKPLEAVQKFEKSISLTQDEVLKRKAYIEISNIYKSLRADSKAEMLNKQIGILEKASNDLNNKDDLVITEMMAEAYYSANMYESASEKFNKLLSIGYDRPYIYRNLAIIYQQMGNLHEAEEILFDMKEKYEDNYTCYLQLAFLYLEMEGQKDQDFRDYSEVVNNYNLAVKFSPSGEQSSDLIPLKNKISELKQKGWL